MSSIEPTVDLAVVGTFLKRSALLTLMGATLGALIGLSISFALPRQYTAVGSFVPEVRRPTTLPTALSGLASQFGLDLGSDPQQSARFYVAVLESRDLKRELLTRRYPLDRQIKAEHADSAGLLDLLKITGSSNETRVERGVRAINRVLAVDVDYTTSVVTVAVTLRDPVAAAAVARTLIELVNRFNSETRQSRARATRLFIERRILEADSQLRQAEEGLRGFYVSNRQWESSPTLRVQEGRLRREVDLRQEVSLTLRRQYEMARIDEVNDTPLISIIDAPNVPQIPSSPRRAVWTAVCTVLGVFGGLLASLARQARKGVPIVLPQKPETGGSQAMTRQ